MNGVQCRMARTATGLGIRDLAARAGIAASTLQRIERDEDVRVSSVRAVREALEAVGVIFLEEDERHGPGIRLRKGVVR